MAEKSHNINQHIMNLSENHTALDHCLMSPNERFFLSNMSQKKDVIEIGSFRGGSSEIIARMATSLICVDPHTDDLPNEWYKVHGVSAVDIQLEFFKSIAPFNHVKYLQMYSDDAWGYMKCWGKKYDVLLVDGDHSYDQCLKDLQHFVPLVKKGGHVLVHDYCLWLSGVIAASQNYFQRFPDQLIDSLAVWEV